MHVRVMILCLLVAHVALGQTRTVREARGTSTGYDGSGEIPGLKPSPSSVITPALPDGPASTFTVTTTNDTGAGSLRKAIADANTNPGLDYISFNVGPPGTLVSILPKSPLPTITSPVVIDGTTQPGFSGHPHVEIRGDSISLQASGLTIASAATGSTIRSIGISNFLGDGIDISANNTVVEGCWIGYGIVNVAYGNLYHGVYLNASNCRIGGTVDSARNVVVRSGRFGILVYGLANNNVIQGNRIGVDPSGSIAFGNAWDGIRLNWSSAQGAGPTNTLVGGTTPGARNIISGNDSAGVGLYGGYVTSNRIVGNYIGTDASGTQAIPNGREGIAFQNFSSQVTGTAARNIVGGGTPAERNVISGNRMSGIAFVGGWFGGNDNLILGNIIGLNAAADSPLGNGGDGISLKLPYGGVLQRTQIGGSTADSGNFICNNHGAGVSLSGTAITQTRIRRNSIFGNDSLGIDLGANRVTPNDSLDGDTGPNGLQNFPIIDSVVVTTSSTKIFGRLDARPNQRYTIEFYTSESADAWHFGEGKTFFVEDPNVVCDNTGRRPFQEIVSVPLPANTFVTATATDTLGNTSEFSQAVSPADQDGDGIYDMWETQGWGIDVNSDALIDLDLYVLGARPDHKDLFVEVDGMTGLAPDLVTLGTVEQAFADAPDSLLHNPDAVGGVNLFTFLSDVNITRTPWSSPQEALDSLHALKSRYFGSPADRASANKRFILEAKKLVFRYCLFADRFDAALHSGVTEYPNLPTSAARNDFLVAHGGWNPDGGTAAQQAGTFMHELGHTLGLGHGGGDGIHYKPNYISVMNYTWQDPYKWAPPGTWALRYSTAMLPTLNENNLNEQNGLGAVDGQYSIMPVPFRDGFARVHYATLAPHTKADWDGNGDSNQTNVPVDISHLDLSPPSSFDNLVGFTDWSHLNYNFRKSPAFVDSPPLSPQDSVVVDEMTPELFEMLNNLPPPKPSGHFVMDGQLDVSASLLSSNNGITLYGKIRGSQLYVAANSAQSQGGDMFIFVAVTPGTMASAPWNKAGQVAGWSAVLANESGDNSTVWLDGSSRDLFAISTDTAGTILEGVIDLEYLTGVSPPTVYLAVGKYGTANGDPLIAQAPAGNGNGNIEAAEFISLDTALPIQLASFTAAPLSNGRVRMDWTTLSEINNYGFEIQRKRAGDPGFQTLSNSFVPGHGTTNEPHSYSFIDSTASSGQWSYRLKQIDLDGTVHYGPELVIDLLTGVEEGAVPTAFALYQNFPNPFNPTTSIRFDIPRLSHVNLTVYNVLGQEVMALVNETRRPGKYEALFNASSLSSGVYFCKLKTDGYVSTKKMIVTK